MYIDLKNRYTGETYSFIAEAGGYISLKVEDARQPSGSSYKQICEGGCFFGSTITAKDASDLEMKARKWLKSSLTLKSYIVKA